MYGREENEVNGRKTFFRNTRASIFGESFLNVAWFSKFTFVENSNEFIRVFPENVRPVAKVFSGEPEIANAEYDGP